MFLEIKELVPSEKTSSMPDCSGLPVLLKFILLNASAFQVLVFLQENKTENADNTAIRDNNMIFFNSLVIYINFNYQRSVFQMSG